MPPFVLPVDAPPPESVFRLSVAQYHEMARTGIIGDEDRLELLDGWLVRKMIIKPAHATATELVSDALRDLLPPHRCVRTQQPVTLATSEPEPDVAVVSGDRLRYAERHPFPPEVALVVEVADSTLLRDRTMKQQIYAEAGIREYWIVNLVEQRVEILSDPGGTGAASHYQHRRETGPDATIELNLDGRTVGQIQTVRFLALPGQSQTGQI